MSVAEKPPIIICEHGAFLKGRCEACNQLDHTEWEKTAKARVNEIVLFFMRPLR